MGEEDYPGRPYEPEGLDPEQRAAIAAAAATGAWQVGRKAFRVVQERRRAPDRLTRRREIRGACARTYDCFIAVLDEGSGHLVASNIDRLPSKVESLTERVRQSQQQVARLDLELRVREKVVDSARAALREAEKFRDALVSYSTNAVEKQHVDEAETRLRDAVEAFRKVVRTKT